MSNVLQQDAEEELRSFLGDYPLLSEDKPKESTTRVKLPPLIILPFYTLGITLAAMIAFVVLLIAALRDGIMWTIKQRVYRNQLQMYYSVGDIWRQYLLHFKVYFLSWKFSAAAKANRGYVDVPTDWLFVPLQKAGHSAVEVYRRITWDPGELLAAAWFALVVTPYALFTWALISMLVIGTPVIVTQVHPNAKPVVTAPVTPPAYQPTETQVQEKDFGPWLTYEQGMALSGKPHVNNMALLTDTGTPRYSAKWTVSPADPSWTQSASFYVTSHQAKGSSVTFEDDTANPSTFHLNVNQPFSFENKIALIFRIDEHGQLWQALKSDVKLIPLKDGWQGAAPNSQLSR
ncbi:MAG TPA: hypothetical protein VLA04_05280 [Verrucomicrobiae bacterium]|nr:hypothetical protein [Verrucomicrobiae bacterium]